jgi:Cys-tRNA(Pro)/Cys-tRNA(Cys) deacylase
VRTSVTDLLDSLGVAYAVKTHEQPALTAETAAAERRVRVSQIVKCMVGRTNSEQLVVMLIPGDRKLKSSRARKHVRAASLDLVPPNLLESELGLIVGAISPTQLLGQARILMDPLVLDEEFVDISSADPMAGVELRSLDLQSVLGAELVPITSVNG